jgi:hypothetical protein
MGQNYIIGPLWKSKCYTFALILKWQKSDRLNIKEKLLCYIWIYSKTIIERMAICLNMSQNNDYYSELNAKIPVSLNCQKFS